MARTAKKKIGIYDHGVLLTADADSIDFEGAGVVSSIFNNAVTESISGGGSGGSSIATEKLSGTQSGNNVTLNLASLAHSFTGVLLVMRNGQGLTPLTSWSISGSTVTILNAFAGDDYLVQYTY